MPHKGQHTCSGLNNCRIELPGYALPTGLGYLALTPWPLGGLRAEKNFLLQRLSGVTVLWYLLQDTFPVHEIPWALVSVVEAGKYILHMLK